MSNCDEQIEAIRDFFFHVNKLKEMGIIRSDVLLGDIGEFLCSKIFNGFVRSTEKTTKGIDGTLYGKKVQIKYSNSADTKNIDLGNPEEYDLLILVLGAQSSHRQESDSQDYVFYQFADSEVKEKFAVDSGWKFSKTKHFREPTKVFNFDINAK